MKRLSIFNISKKNLVHRKIRTSFLIAFVALLSATMFVTSTLIGSMNSGIKNAVNRMGADIIVVPNEYASDMTSSLFLGELCNFSFDRNLMSVTENIEGIDKISPQLYIATLAASCCSVPVQIIAFDPKTDFIVQPWINEINIDSLKKGEVVAGSAISSVTGGTLTFFNTDFIVRGKLEKTNTGYDTCIFMDFDTANMLFDSETFNQLSGLENPYNAISSLMISVSDNADIKTVARKINYSADNTSLTAYTSNGIFSSVADSLSNMSTYSNILITLLFIMTVLAVLCIFTITVNERKYEFGVMISAGSTKLRIMIILLVEAGIIGLCGGVIGTAVSAGVMLIFENLIKNSLEIPYLFNSVSETANTFVKCIVISLGTSLLSALYSVISVYRTEPLKMIQGEQK